MLMVSPPWATAVFLARIVMPFSRSRSPESSTRSATRSFARKAPDCHSIASTSVVLPWSTWATIATLRMSSRVGTTPMLRRGITVRSGAARSRTPGPICRRALERLGRRAAEVRSEWGSGNRTFGVGQRPHPFPMLGDLYRPPERRTPPMRRISTLIVALATAASGLALLPTTPAAAVDADHGSTIVSADPANFTPQIMDDTGIVYAITQVGSQIVVGGVFTQVKQPGGTPVTRSNLFAFDATTGVINPTFAPTFDGEVDSLATDGT